MSYHADKEVNQAFIRLMDALCSWERNTFRGSKLIFVPDTIDHHEKTILVMDGKPVSHGPLILRNILDDLKLRQTSEVKTQ